MRKPSLLVTFTLLACFCLSGHSEWGFFGHRRINRLAIFTLPPQLGTFYKSNIDFITEHAVDPDKRRYATKHEAVRHYIDIDHWGTYPFDNLPRDLDNAVLKYGSLHVVTAANDTIEVKREENISDGKDHQFLSSNMYRFKDTLLPAYRKILKSQYYDDQMVVDKVHLSDFFEGECQDVISMIFKDHFSEYGIVPYHLYDYYGKLVYAFKTKNTKRILRLSTEIGHYIGDASVPLHTTTNYNGQLTNQIGIHAFWESRIPELFADQSFDPISGRASYILDPKMYFWEIVFESHLLVDDVLRLEKQLSEDYPQDQQYCYVERLNATVRTQCEDYAKEYADELDGMVEERWHRAIQAIGSVWYSAWLDAGSPNLSGEVDLAVDDEKQSLDKIYKSGAAKGRAHDDY